MNEQLDLFGFAPSQYIIKKPIRLIELFADIGAQSKALEVLKANFESYKIAEWSKESIKAYTYIHHYEEIKNCNDKEINSLSGISRNYNEPMTKEQINNLKEDEKILLTNCKKITHNLIDISKVKGEDLNIVDTDKYEYVLTFSFPCGLKGEKIKTKAGYKNIEDVKVGDYVLTHTNTYKKVVKTMTRQTQGYYKIKYLGGESLLTSEHPLYVYRDSKFQWVKVKDLTLSDRVSFNINNKEIDVDLSNEYLWLLGRYVADGWVNKYHYNSVDFAIGNKKEDEFLKNIPQDFKENFKKTQKSCLDYRIADKELKQYCLQFGQGAKNKKIPEWVLNLPKSKLQSFFDGYISGDGHVRMKGKSKEIMFSTVSFELFLGLQLIVAKLYSRICSMYVRKDNRKETFNDTYNCQVIPSSSSTCQEVIEDKIVTRISKIEYIDELVDVFNFEVETDNSYTINNIIVHNCQDLSLAGKLGGMEEDSGTRSSLLWEVERLLKECKEKGNLPNTLLMKNVPQVIGTKNKSAFHKFMKRLEDLGYKNFVKVLNAKDFYIPQNRQRCFMVSILTKEDVFSFPNKMKLDYYLLDFLDKEVDEKYYLSDDKIIQIQNWKGFENPLEDIDPNRVCSTLTTHCGKDSNGMQLVLVPENTKKGYAEAKVGDGVYINRPHQKRGVVQKGMIQTIKTSCDDIGVVVDDNSMKKILCNKLIESGKVREGDVIRHSYSKNRIEEIDNGKYRKENTNNNICPTLETRCDCLGICVNDNKYLGTYEYSKSNNFMQNKSRFEPDKKVSNTLLASGNNNGIVVLSNYSPSNHNASRIIDPKGIAPTVMENHGTVTEILTDKPKVIGGIGEKKSNNGTQWFLQDRIYDNNIATSICTSFNPYYLTKHLRIRKLTPCECYKLMGFTQIDYERCAKIQSNATIYHQAGDSIVVTVLIAIFGKLLGMNYEKVIK